MKMICLILFVDDVNLLKVTSGGFPLLRSIARGSSAPISQSLRSKDEAVRKLLSGMSTLLSEDLAGSPEFGNGSKAYRNILKYTEMY